ncbi:MAG: hypothetical protein HOC71_05170 [Candidatus Latescibacteria bacterium]|jgi:hypothetical protein|nr:hypothetical protein [Candidatus Latescibacterota bacterium]
MPKPRLIIFFFFFLACNITFAYSQMNSFKMMADYLAESSHRDINIVENNNVLKIYYWPIGFRDEYQGYVDAKKTVLKYINQIENNGIESLEFIQTSWGIPVITTKLYRKNDIKSEVFVKDYHVCEKVQPSLFPARKLLLLFDIPVTMNFGQPFDPFIFKTGIRPELRLKICKGVIAYTQIEFYIHNEYDVHEYVYPGSTGILLMKTINDNTLTFTNIGIMGTDIYGVDEEINISLYNNLFALEFHGGIYGDYEFKNSKFKYYKFDKNLALLKFLYFNEKYDCVLKFFGGRFLYGDKGVGCEISRVFNEVEIGFTGIKSGGDIAANVFFSIPFFPKSRRSLAKHGISFKKSFHCKYWYYSNDLGKEPMLPTSIKSITGYSNPHHFSFMSKFYKNHDNTE